MINIQCRMCTRQWEVPITEEQYQEWKTNRRNSPLIQDHFPDLNANQRELILSNTCPDCWDDLWKEEDDATSYD